MTIQITKKTTLSFTKRIDNCYVFYQFRKKQDIDKEKRLYHLHVIQIANAIPNHKQDDIQNIEQSVDILKRGKLQQDTNSAPD
jgi:hypothetical protein